MFRKLSALHAPEGDGTDGAGAGGSSEDGQGKDEKDLVPASRLKAALESQERKLRAEFRAEIDTLKATAKEPAPNAEEPKRYSRAELLAAVKANQITQEAADAEWERQIVESATAKATLAASNTVSTGQRKERVTSEISRYVAAAPEIKEDGHEKRELIKEEFQALVELGDDPKALATELKAIRAVLGPIEKLERARAGKDSHEGHRETGGSGSGSGSRPSKSFKDSLPVRNRDYYDGQIKAGRYKDWTEIEKMHAKHARPGA